MFEENDVKCDMQTIKFKGGEVRIRMEDNENESLNKR